MKTYAKKLSAALAASTMLFAAPALADHHVETAAETAVEAAPEGPALWKVADEDTTIYLFGTVHALPKDVDWYKGPIAEALGSSDAFITEVMMDEKAAGRMQELVGTTAILPQGTTLRSLMTEEQRTHYETAMAKLGMPAAAFDQFEPWYAGLMMTMLPLMQQGYSPESGVEKVLTDYAKGKKLGELETIDFQLGMFDSLPQESQIKFLVDAAENIDEIKPMLDKMVAEWLKGDADDLAELMNEDMDDPVLMDELLYKRNANWADWIDTRLDTPGTVFIAVGAGHLAGKKSVQDVLETKGLTVVRVTE